jgi:inhibitor of cysteine peptidase
MKKLFTFAIALITIFSTCFVGNLSADAATNLAYSLRGRILLQVEDNGEAWYVNPLNSQRYYLGRPDDAFSIMRNLGLGITNANLSKIQVGLIPGQVQPDDAHSSNYINWTLARSLSGRILLQVEDHGEAWYINPLDLKRYYLGRAADAFEIMRYFGLGITNANLNTIPISPDSPAVISETEPENPVVENPPKSYSDNLRTFVSNIDFEEYIDEANSSYSSYNYNLPMTELPAASPATESSSTSDRSSDTNVQVLGVDEPDNVKNNGDEIFFADNTYGYIYRDNYYKYLQPTIKVIDGYPLSDLKLDAKIDDSGKLLLHENTLMVFDNYGITAYDVSQSDNPTVKWEITNDYDTAYIDARLYGDNLYLMTQHYFYSYQYDETPACPMISMWTAEQDITIDCSDIWAPEKPIMSNSIVSVYKINPATGEFLADKNLLAPWDNPVFFMSTNSLYMSYYYFNSYFEFYYGFLVDNQNLFPTEEFAKFTAIKNSDDDDYSRMYELNAELESYLDTLSDNTYIYLKNELNNKFDTYIKQHYREYERTNIYKMNLSDLAVSAKGEIPGQLLNQFSLGENNGYLYAATTIGQNSWMWGTQLASFSDVYVLDSSLTQTGAIKDLGLTERIYSVRFIGDKGYVVTFRQVDPFYVLDLSSPTNPKMTGELKIPGYSAYLHPLEGNLILGVGRDESGNVKLSLFDVSNPSSPVEKSKYVMDEYYSDVLNDPRAFLQDQKHQVFFIPGSQAGYVFSYSGNSIELKKAVTDYSPLRAVYINDYMYLLGADGLTVLDENTWEIVKQLEY